MYNTSNTLTSALFNYTQFYAKTEPQLLLLKEIKCCDSNLLWELLGFDPLCTLWWLLLSLYKPKWKLRRQQSLGSCWSTRENIQPSYILISLLIVNIPTLRLWINEQQASVMLQLPLLVTAQVDLVLLLVSAVAFWTRLGHLSYPNAVVWVSPFCLCCVCPLWGLILMPLCV